MTKTPAPVGGSGPAPHDGTVWQEADGAQQSGSGSFGGHRSMVPAADPGYRASDMDRRLTTAALVIGLAAAASPLSIAPADAALIGSSATRTGPVAPAAATGPALTPGMQAGLQARLDRLRLKAAIPGISAAILFPDGTVWRGSSGFANVKAKTPVTPETAFAVASVSKTFTAALILALCDEGRLRLGTSVASLLPGLRLDPKITVRQLLDHTSGLRDFFLDARSTRHSRARAAGPGPRPRR